MFYNLRYSIIVKRPPTKNGKVISFTLLELFNSQNFKFKLLSIFIKQALPLFFIKILTGSK